MNLFLATPSETTTRWSAFEKHHQDSSPELKSERRLDGTRIATAVKDGTVTLTGTSEFPFAKNAYLPDGIFAR